MDREIAFLAAYAFGLLFFGLGIAGLFGALIRRRKPAPDHVENYWRQGE